jgi:hypothetical protein
MKDAFISHASEDKKALAEPIYHSLTNYGQDIWLDKYELIPGKSLMRQIDDGLIASRYGILLITPSFMKKSWPKVELQALFSAMMAGEKEIIPVWHDVTQKDVRKFSPLLADLLAVTTSGKTIDDVAVEILRVVSPKMAQGLLRVRIAEERMNNSDYKQLEIDDLPTIQSGGPIVHEELPKRVISDAALICEIFSEFKFMNLIEFMDNLSRDHHYDNELTVWHKISAIYLWSIQKFRLQKHEERKQAFTLINALSMFKDLPSERTNFDLLKPETVKVIRNAWKEWPASYGNGEKLY